MAQETVRDLLANPRYELLPFMGFESEVEHLPHGATVAITASPEKGVDLTIDRSVELAAAGFDVSPHLAARAVESDDHLVEICDRLVEAGIDDVFVPGGDNKEPAGPFDSSLALLERMDDLGYAFDAVGITGYPEGHPIIDDDVLWESLEAKAPLADYVVSQLCFDPVAIVDWTEAVRDRGIDLPLYVGIPGVLRYQRLLSISQKVGVGDSIRFLRKTTGLFGFIRQLLGSQGHYRPTRLVEALSPYAHDDEYAIAGVHLYTFNQVADCEGWRQAQLD